MREGLRRALRRRGPLRRLLRALTRTIADAGGTAYLVGGYLRDIAEGKETGDVDLLVTGLSYRRTGELLRSLESRTQAIRKVDIVPSGNWYAICTGPGIMQMSCGSCSA